MKSSHGRIRTVSYWLSRPDVRLSNKMPKFFYHGTATNLWYDQIKRKGLAPRNITGSSGSYGSQNLHALSYENLVYISTDPDAATREAASQSSRKHGGRPMIIRIDSTGLDPERLVPDEDTQAKTPQASVDISSTLAYRGIIPADRLEPFLIQKQDKWERFKDVPVEEHPITTKLKNGETWGLHSMPEYYALLDAGIIEETIGRAGSILKILDNNITNEKILSILKDSGWTQTVKMILSDIALQNTGTIQQLRTNFDKDITKESTIRMLLDSGIVRGPYDLTGNTCHFEIEYYFNTTKNAIKLAKSIGKMGFKEFISKLEDAIRKYKIL